MFSLEQVERLDLDGIAVRVARKSGWSMDRALAATASYREFLAKCGANPLGSVRPTSQDVDEVWHTHILDTQKYEEDCQLLFGCFLHHVPTDGATQVGTPDNLQTTCDSRLTSAVATCESRLTHQKGSTTCESRQALSS